MRLCGAIGGALLAAAILVGAVAEALAEVNSAAAPYTIAVHISRAPVKDGKAALQEADAIEDLVTQRVELLNKAGGLLGRRVKAVFYDDQEQLQRTKDNVAKALADPNLIAMVGLWDSSRGAEVIDGIGLSNVPLISELSVETLFAAYQNVFTLTRSVRHEQQVLESFAATKFKRIAIVAADDDRYTKAYVDYISNSQIGASLLAPPLWLKRLSDNPPEVVDRVVAELKRLNPDFVFLSLGSPKGAAFLNRLAAEGLEPAIFLGRGSVIDMNKVPGGIGAFKGAIYELAEGGIANLLNERLEQLKRQPDMRQAAKKYESKPFSYGIRYGDLVALIVESAAGTAQPADGSVPSIRAIRNAVRASLGGLREGRKVWRGWAQDWSFTLERASSERSLLVWRPPGRDMTVLAPMQFMPSGHGLVPVPVLQAHLDVVRIYRADTNDKSFEADFYLTLHSDNGVPQKSIEFTNAYRGYQRSLVNIRQIHQEPAGSERPTTRIFKVSGKFTFEPDLRKYPFDEQVFSISFQPESTASPFLLQPPSDELMGYKFSVDGWTVKDRYVGSNDLIIRSVAGEMSEERIIPYYNFNYTWVMKRQVVDYVIRVLVPLSLILVVAYLANYIPRSDFEATIAIQVTALLSAIALYLALNQPSADDATLSDQIFVVAYGTISVMIALSIFEVNTVLARSAGVIRVIYFAQFYLVPIVALASIAAVLASASLDAGLWDALVGLQRRIIAVLRPAA